LKAKTGGLAGWNVAFTILSLGAAIGFVLLLTQVLLAPPIRDLALLTMFLVISGGATVLMGWALQRIKMPVLFRSLRARLVITCMLTAVLALVNVGFTAVLMFISTHDLALLAGFLGFSLAISVLVALSISEPTLRSLRALTQAASRVSLGELNTRVPVESSDEVGDLALAFNSMAGQLEASVAKEQELIQTRRELGSSTTELLIGIVPRYSGKLDNFDMRFLKGRGVNEDPNIIHITKVFDQLRGRDFVNPSQTGLIDRLDFYAITRDGIGGIDCYYSTPIPLDKNRTIYFNIQFEASKPWHGYLSFRGRDKNGNFVNHTDVGVKINLPPTPDIEGSPSPTDE
jgi:HAMP domain-containing protein